MQIWEAVEKSKDRLNELTKEGKKPELRKVTWNRLRNSPSITITKELRDIGIEGEWYVIVYTDNNKVIIEKVE